MFPKPSSKKEESLVASSGKLDGASGRKIAPTIISADVRLLGNIISDSMVDVDGRIEGNITSDTVYIRENAVITGDVTTGNAIHVFGTVHGVLKSPKVCIYPSAHIEGAILHKSLTIEDGAYVDAQFKPFDSQVKLSTPRLSEISSLKTDLTGPDEDYDILRDLKLISS
jgi:cytoskeletal protein CcmA (bactofilin family)